MLHKVVSTGLEVGFFPGMSHSIYLDAERVRKEGVEKVKTYRLRPALIWPDGR